VHDALRVEVVRSEGHPQLGHSVAHGHELQAGPSVEGRVSDPILQLLQLSLVERGSDVFVHGSRIVAAKFRLMGMTGEGSVASMGQAERRGRGVDEASLVRLVRDARPHLARTGPQTEEWLTRLDEHHDALHDLMEELIATDPKTALEMAASLWPYWWLRDHMAEGRDLLERVVEIDGADRPAVLKGLGTMAFRQGDAERAEQVFQERLELVERNGDKRDLADALTDLSRIALRRGDFAEVRRYAERAYAAAEGLDREAIRLPLHLRAAAARMEGRLDEARALYLESREINESIGNQINVVGEDHNLMYVALHSGDREEAGRRFQASSQWIFANDNAYFRPYAVLDAGILALHDGDLDRAGRLVACAQRIFEESGTVPDPDDRVELDGAIARLQKELGERFRSVWDEGRQLDLAEAQALARG
jgi:tetratricopeptide (TPR) repeat protein